MEVDDDTAQGGARHQCCGLVVAATVAVPLMAAGTAHATAIVCDNYLDRAGYNVGLVL
ncbi:hypothetical protein [Streptomyces sp. NPDC094147]